MFQFSGLAREFWNQRLLDSFSRLFAVFHALHRLLTPRHPPHALNSLTTLILVSLSRSRRPMPPALRRETNRYQFSVTRKREFRFIAKFLRVILSDTFSDGAKAPYARIEKKMPLFAATKLSKNKTPQIRRLVVCLAATAFMG